MSDDFERRLEARIPGRVIAAGTGQPRRRSAAGPGRAHSVARGRAAADR